MGDKRMALVACLALASCGVRNVPATCTRLKTGEVLHGTARVVGDDGVVVEYYVHDRNGIEGGINAENSDSFSCKLAQVPA